MALHDRINALATRIATVLNGKSNVGHLHDAAAISQGTIDPQRFPRVFFGGYGTVTSAGQNLTWAGDATSFQRLFRVRMTATGNSVAAPTGTALDGQVQKFHFFADGGSRTVEFNSAFRLSTGITSRLFTVPQNQVLIVAVEYSEFIGAWVITAATVSA